MSQELWCFGLYHWHRHPLHRCIFNGGASGSVLTPVYISDPFRRFTAEPSIRRQDYSCCIFLFDVKNVSVNARASQDLCAFVQTKKLPSFSEVWKHPRRSYTLNIYFITLPEHQTGFTFPSFFEREMKSKLLFKVPDSWADLLMVLSCLSGTHNGDHFTDFFWTHRVELLAAVLCLLMGLDSLQMGWPHCLISLLWTDAAAQPWSMGGNVSFRHVSCKATLTFPPVPVYISVSTCV